MSSTPLSVVAVSPLLARFYSFAWNLLVGPCKLKLPSYVTDQIEAYEFPVSLPPFLNVMDEINLECFSIRGQAWTGNNRLSINCGYKSPLLDSLGNLWRQATFDGDARIVEQSHIYLDPRLAAYHSMMLVDLPRWQGIVARARDIATEESISAWEIRGSNYPIENEFSKKELLEIVVDRLSEAGLPYTKEKNGGLTDLRIPIISMDPNGAALHGVLGVGISRGRALVDQRVVLKRTEGGEIFLSALPLHHLLMPYGSYYFNEYNDTRRMLFGVDVAIKLFCEIGDKQGKR